MQAPVVSTSMSSHSDTETGEKAMHDARQCRVRVKIPVIVAARKMLFGTLFPNF